MNFNFAGYCLLDDPFGERLDLHGFVNPNNVDSFRFRAKRKKGLPQQDESVESSSKCPNIFDSSIKPACKEVLNKVRPLYERTCNRLKSPTTGTSLGELRPNVSPLSESTVN
ncbi:uncharacterized protein LOC111624756 isoform X2 [Centruroides sculpturatus]|uniref:uncharacterized protein LOC111624756 isoform X2 n=1 Tax=Centruroides sculpturatus TaxID=218467 RepID=UPI000C6E7248|nr:uncharacterized protein LOC111624756 isoform X2 [Centruroides sculpturatus]